MPRRSGTARIQYIDRNPLAVDRSVGTVALAPHAKTTRWTYTVPALRLAVSNTCILAIMRNTAAAPVGVVTNTITKGGVDVLVNFMLGNAIDSRSSMFIGQSLLILTGEIVTATTEDLSTGGTVTYYQASSMTEFDK